MAAPASNQGEGLLSLVGTPIGNLSDASPRVIDTLRTSDVILCEDTRVTGRLMSSFGLHVPLQRADENVLGRRIEGTLQRIAAGEHVSFVSDAGMPGVSDPGQRLVDAALDAGLRVEVIPGPSAVTCALVASGLPMEHFFFEGFLPRKHGAIVARLRELAPIPGALVLYESPHRVAATLAAIAEVLPLRRVALVRELTKLHEEVLRGPAPELAARVAERGEIRGECVLVIEGPVAGEVEAIVGDETPELSLDEAIISGLEAGEPKSGLAKRLSRERGLARSTVYDRVVELARTVGMALVLALASASILSAGEVHASELPPVAGIEQEEPADPASEAQPVTSASPEDVDESDDGDPAVVTEVTDSEEPATSHDPSADEGLQPVLEAQAKKDGWVYSKDDDCYRYYQASKPYVGWLVTDVTPQGAKGGPQRYWLGEDGVLAQGRVVSPDEGNNAWWAYARPEGYVVRGSYRVGDLVYLADNDGRLPTRDGWLVTRDFGQSLQRYYIETDEESGAHVAVVGPSTKGWAHCTRPEGYVVRGSYRDGDVIYLADNDGRAPTGKGWFVTAAYAGDLQRYYLYEQMPGVSAAHRGPSADGWAHYTRPEGYVARGVYASGSDIYIADNDGRLLGLPAASDGSHPKQGWLVSDRVHGTLQRYYLYAVAEGVYAAHMGGSTDGWPHFTRKEGFVARGVYRNGQVVYLADNDGRLPSQEGWLVTGNYTGGALQRYWLSKQEGGVCAARTGLSSDGYLHYTMDSGYVLRNKLRLIDGTWYKANNDGLLVETSPVAISESFRWSLCHGPKGAEYQRYIVLHDTEGSTNAWNVIDGWEDSGNYVAAHFVINRDGSIVQCVPMDQIAHHAGFGDTGHNALYGISESSRDDHRGTVGIGSWASDYGMNAWSIGIEMVHYGSQSYPTAQLVALDGLIAYIDGYFGFESTIIDHKMWRSYNSDTSDNFAWYLANYQRTRTHDGS